MNGALDSCDAATTLVFAGDLELRSRLIEVERLEVLAHWAALHSSDPAAGPDGSYEQLIGNVLVTLGGEGTPGVQDFCLGEIAIARSASVTATTNAIADVLDLQHRLPLLWRRCRAGEAEVWVARKVAKMTRHLPACRVGLVDSAIARIVDREAAGRVLEVAEAKVVEADPALHEQRVQAQRARRYVGSGRTDEFGLRTVIARVEAGDALWVEATVARVAEILAPAHPDSDADEVRAVAFGYLARPAELLQLLLEHADAQDELDLQVTDGVDGGTLLNRAMACPADLLEVLRSADLSALRPKAVLYVHLHEAALNGAGGVARIESLGPRTLASLAELLAVTDLSIRPVLDLSERVRSIAYEHPESLRERVHLAVGADYWPYATSTTRRVDYDHPTPYDDTGPPGQTGSHNSGPLGRRHHRWKTHAGYRARQCGDGRYAWLTPHGLGLIVDHTGTRQIDPEHARMIIDAPSGVDLYPVA